MRGGLALLLCALGVALPSASFAATGDLVVVCYNSDGNDEFALIALATRTMVDRFAVTGTPLSTKLSFNASTLTAVAYPPDAAITITDGWQVGWLPRPSQGAGNSESHLPARQIA